jgi:hypothetical protein
MIRCSFNHRGLGPQCCVETPTGEHKGPHFFKCAGPACPGLTWPASVMAHPFTCNQAPSATSAEAPPVEAP